MNRKSPLMLVIALAALGLLIFAFIQGRTEFAKEKEREAPVKSPSRVSTTNHEVVVTLDKATRAQTAITVVPLAANTTAAERQAYATVLSVQDLADARAAYAGSKAQLDKARASLEAARKDYQRLNALHNDDRNISDRAFQAGAAALATEQADVQAAQIASQSSLSAVVQRYGDVIAGWLATEAAVLKRVLQQQEVLVQVTFPAEATTGAAPRTIRIQAAPNVFAMATLVARSPHMDSRVQGISYLYVAPAESLVPGMNVLALLPTKGGDPTGVVVPQSAAVWWQGKSWIYVQRSPDHFARVEVAMDQPVKNGFVVRSGLGPNDQVVATGAQLLLSEEFRSQIQIGDEGK